MNASNRPRYTRHFYIACLLARSAAFLFLVGYALTAPESFQADLTASPFHLTPLTAVWALLMLSMISRFFRKPEGHRVFLHGYAGASLRVAIREALRALQFGTHLHFSVTHGKLVLGIDSGGQVVGGVVGQYAVVLYAVQHQFTFLQFI